MENLVRWIGVDVRTVAKEATDKIRKRAKKEKSLSYQAFRELLGKESGLSPTQVLGAIKVFKPEEGLPDRSKWHLFRKYEVHGSDRCCMVRNPREDELLVFESNEAELNTLNA